MFIVLLYLFTFTNNIPRGLKLCPTYIEAQTKLVCQQVVQKITTVKAPQHHYVTMVKHNSNACLCLYPSNSSVQQPDSQVNNSVHCGLRELELLLTELTAHFLLENLYKYVLHPIPFL